MADWGSFLQGLLQTGGGQAIGQGIANVIKPPEQQEYNPFADKEFLQAYQMGSQVPSLQPLVAKQYGDKLDNLLAEQYASDSYAGAGISPQKFEAMQKDKVNIIEDKLYPEQSNFNTAELMQKENVYSINDLPDNWQEDDKNIYQPLGETGFVMVKPNPAYEEPEEQTYDEVRGTDKDMPSERAKIKLLDNYDVDRVEEEEPLFNIPDDPRAQQELARTAQGQMSAEDSQLPDDFLINNLWREEPTQDATDRLERARETEEEDTFFGDKSGADAVTWIESRDNPKQYFDRFEEIYGFTPDLSQEATSGLFGDMTESEAITWLENRNNPEQYLNEFENQYNRKPDITEEEETGLFAGMDAYEAVQEASEDDNYSEREVEAFKEKYNFHPSEILELPEEEMGISSLPEMLSDMGYDVPSGFTYSNLVSNIENYSEEDVERLNKELNLPADLVAMREKKIENSKTTKEGDTPTEVYDSFIDDALDSNINIYKGWQDLKDAGKLGSYNEKDLKNTLAMKALEEEMDIRAGAFDIPYMVEAGSMKTEELSDEEIRYLKQQREEIDNNIGFYIDKHFGRQLGEFKDKFGQRKVNITNDYVEGFSENIYNQLRKNAEQRAEQTDSSVEAELNKVMNKNTLVNLLMNEDNLNRKSAVKVAEFILQNKDMNANQNDTIDILSW